MDGEGHLTSLSEHRHKKAFICACVFEHQTMYCALLVMVTPIEGTDTNLVAARLPLVYGRICWCPLTSKGTNNLQCAVPIFFVVTATSNPTFPSLKSSNIAATTRSLTNTDEAEALACTCVSFFRRKGSWYNRQRRHQSWRETPCDRKPRLA